MEYQSTEKLSIKETGIRSTGVTKWIREALEEIPEGKALGMKELAKSLVAECPSVKDIRQAYVRINHVLKDSKKFVRLTGQGGTFIAQKSESDTVQ